MKLMAIMNEAGFVGKTIEDLKKLHDSDKHDTELEVMAEVRAYFQVAYKVRERLLVVRRRANATHDQRIIDYVPRAIDAEIVEALASKVRDALTEDLIEASNDGKAKAKSMMQDDPQAAAQREMLQGRQRRLSTARRALQAFGHL